MQQPWLAILLLMSFLGSALADPGLESIKSAHSVDETLNRLESALREKGMKVFARIDHTRGAQEAGMELPPTALLIFGNPKVGTPLMKCGRSVAVDLPQKALAWEDENGQVWLSYNDPRYLAERHGLEDCDEILDKVSRALTNFAEAATRP
jgi:uncharacterized protein (DUF302 family)